MIVPLLYHMVNRRIDAAIAVSEESFAAQLELLEREGYPVLTLEQVLGVVEGKARAPERAVFLTFDDGYADNLDAALPRLLDRGMEATMFVPTRFVGGDNGWNRLATYEARHLDWPELEQWLERGGRIGGHSHDHVDARATAPEEFRISIERGRQLLEERLGVDVPVFAYPYGRATPAARDAVARCYRAAWVVDQGTWDPAHDRFLLNRLAVDRRTSARDLGRDLERLFEGRAADRRRPRPPVPRFAPPEPRSRPRLALVAGGPAEESDRPSGMRFARLLAEGWDVHLLHRDGIFDEPGIAELSDTVLCARVHPPPRSMRRRLPRMGLVLGLLRALARRPLGVTAALARDADPRRRYQRASLLALGADLVHIPSAAEAEAWLDLQPLLEAPIRIGDGDVASTRDEPELHVLAVGPLVWELGFEHLLQAVRQTIDRGVACRCRIVGSGEHETAIAFARRQLGLDRVVDLVVTGPTSPSLGAHFAWADVAAHAAVTTSRPYWLREAQAAGLAIVTTEAVPGVAATTVSRRDAERLADALVGFAASPSIAARLTAAPAAIDADEARVTILLPVRAYHEAFLGAALDAVFRQTSPRWRLLIVDDGAEGPAFERLTAAALRDPRVRRVSGEGHGLAAALNTGYRAARTEFVASLFADDLWADDAVEVLTRAIERSPEIDFFHSSRRFIDEQGRALSSVYRARDRVGVADFVTGSPVKHLLCVRRSAALAIGGVDESVGPIAADDYDFPWTMAEAGARFAAIPECLYLFRDHREVFRLTTHVPRNEHVRGLRRIFRKHGVGRLRAEWRLWTAKQSYLRQCLYRSRFDHWLKRALGADPRRGARELYT